MSYRETYLQSRARYLAAYDAEGAERYDAWIKSLSDEDHEACLADMQPWVPFTEGMQVLDAGAGTGAMSLLLSRIPGLAITALEPCPAMLQLFRSKPELAKVRTVSGFCDHPSDNTLFPSETFDWIVSRQLTNCLFDPLAAFRNWHSWLRPSGGVLIVDGLFNREDWSGVWQEAVDLLPLAACRTTATVPYLLEQVGFEIKHVGLMAATNQRPSTRTLRYLVVATKPTEQFSGQEA